jgi:predicted AAA+ superfamily ATPase
MFARSIQLPKDRSFFLFGPRGTGKSTLLRERLPGAFELDLLDLGTYGELLAHPERLEARIAAHQSDWTVIDEVQRIPALLDEVHRLIEKRKWRFALTGSSARKLRRGSANLLAGRARVLAMHPLSAAELGPSFDLQRSLRFGQLPSAYTDDDPAAYLASYVGTYLREEVQAEALTRNLQAFSRFLVGATFSQGSILSVTGVARDLGLPRKTVDGYFDLLDDLLLSVRLPVFARRAKRAMATHRKFYLFDAGVFRALRPKGPLDSAEEIDGPAVETLVLQELRATNDNLGLGYELFTWHTRDHREVDFVLYGDRGLWAIEVKRTSTYRDRDLEALRLFKQDYAMAHCVLLYGGERAYDFDGIRVLPLGDTLARLGELLAGPDRVLGADQE